VIKDFNKIIEYGVTLDKLKRSNLELVRCWRNSPAVSNNMIYQEYITTEMQHKWFDHVNNDNNFYYIASYNNCKIGVANIKDIDYQRKVGEAGLFIGNIDYQNLGLCFPIMLALYDFAFYKIGLNTTYIKVLTKNVRALRFDLKFGYEKCSTNEQDLDNNSVIKYFLKRNSYEVSTFAMKKIFNKLSHKY